MEGAVDPVGEWLGGGAAIDVIDTASVSLVREQRRGAVPGVEVVAADVGPGIEDVAGALRGRASRPGSLGAGLSAVLELSDEVDVDVRLGEGTCVSARKFAAMVPSGRRVGVFGRPFPGEPVSGDDGGVVRSGGAIAVALVDGLGHGPLARDASSRARHVLVRHPDLPPSELLSFCDVALRGTRGAVMAAAQVDPNGLTFAAVGDVGAHVYGPRGSKRFAATSAILGTRGGARRARDERQELEAWDVVVFFTDGVTSRLDLAGDRELLREHPIVVAAHVVERFARPNDDVLVIVLG